MEKLYIYKLTFRNGCTYIGKHHQKRDFDQYITSSSYYKKHKDLLEKREIILEVNDIDTLDIMETICILGDTAENTLNVNYNYGAWLSKSKFDRGYTGASNGIFGRKQSDLVRMKMKAKWTRDRKKRASKKMKKISNTDEWKQSIAKLNRDPEHIKKVNESRKASLLKHARYVCINDDSVVIDYETFIKYPNITFRRTIDDTPVRGDFEEWLKNHRTGHGMASKGKHWFNNGIIETYAFECPEGFVKGRLKFKKETIANMKAAAQRLLSKGGNRHRTGSTPWNKGLKGVKRKCQMDK